MSGSSPRIALRAILTVSALVLVSRTILLGCDEVSGECRVADGGTVQLWLKVPSLCACLVIAKSSAQLIRSVSSSLTDRHLQEKCLGNVLEDD